MALAIWLPALFLSTLLHAHDADTSYARVRILDDRIEVRLALDVFSLRRIAPGLDANADGALSREELRRATPAIQKFLRAHVGIEVDEAASDLGAAKDPFWPLDAPDPIPAAAWHTNEALISFGFDRPLAAPAKSVSLAFDVFRTLGERHSVLGVFEYRGQSTEVVFTMAEPDYLFDVAYAAPGTTAPQRGNANDSPAWSHFKMGIEHILTGWDHLCFLLALLVVSRLRPLVGIVTSFTVAHSITLLLGAFEIVRLPSRFIECAVALTILYVGCENLWREKFSHRWLLTFFFGLVHGFAFANSINPQELPVDQKAKCLLVFNLGVEVGQLAVVLALLRVSVLLAKSGHGRRWKTGISVAVAVLGLAWFLDRALNLGWMPF